MRHALRQACCFAGTRAPPSDDTPYIGTRAGCVVQPRTRSLFFRRPFDIFRRPHRLQSSPICQKAASMRTAVRNTADSAARRAALSPAQTASSASAKAAAASWKAGSA
ncbi:hypothetical protein LVJ84_03165 [Kingella potus]|nr:hypothetical protein [Kingella potus]UOP01276.1 hypothetical protein LVJ84_03165 [Kingella potus]